MENGYRLQVQPEAVRACARRLRQWSEQWLELGKRAQAVGGQLAEATRAVPGERFGEIWTARAPRWAQKAERSRQLALALEEGIARLEQAFQEAAQGLRALSLTPQGPLPEAPLAVDADGRPLASQFEMRIDPAFLRQAGVPDETIARLQERDGRIRWYAACGPVALSVALTHLLGQPVPAQEVVNRMLAERMADSKFRERIQSDVANRIQEGRPGMGFYTGESDLKAAARPYGAQVERISLPGGQQDPDVLWQALQERMEQREPLMMLVRIQEKPGPNPGDGKLVPYIPEDSATVPHWVTLDGMEEQADGRYITLYNPYRNTRERYRWEEFLASIDGQVRGERWWALSVQRSNSGGKP